jgi:hypothetical protein
MCDDLRQEPAEAERHWQRIAPVIAADDIKLVRSMIGLLPKLGALLEYSSGLSEGADPVPAFQGMMAFNQLRSASGRMAKLSTPVKSDDGMILQAPIIRVPLALEPLHRLMLHLADTFKLDKQNEDLLVQIGRDEKKLLEFTHMIDSVGDGFSRFWYGLLLHERAMTYAFGPNRNDERYHAHLREALAAFDRARREPGFIDTRKVAWHMYIHAAAQLGAPDRKGADPEMARLAARELRDLMRRGPLPASVRGTYAKAARYAKDWNLARDILDEWDRRKPNDPAALEQRARVEFESGSYANAVTAARAWAQAAPMSAEAKRILAEATAKLKEQYAQLVP